MKLREDDFSANARGRDAVNNLSNFAVERLRQKEKTKRILIIGEFLLVAFAVSIMLFAPNEKEKVAYIIGAILLVLALGAIGANKFVFKFFGITVDTKQNGLPLISHRLPSDCESKYAECTNNVSAISADEYNASPSDAQDSLPK
jgi:hypothetical protein